jgi:hypothetical protein
MDMVFLFIADGKDSKEQGYCSSPGLAQGKYFWIPCHGNTLKIHVGIITSFVYVKFSLVFLNMESGMSNARGTKNFITFFCNLVGG